MKPSLLRRIALRVGIALVAVPLASLFVWLRLTWGMERQFFWAFIGGVILCIAGWSFAVAEGKVEKHPRPRRSEMKYDD